MEPTRNLSIPTIPQAIGALYQAVMLGQKAGIYTLDDANQISIALHALRFRLHLDQQMRPLWNQAGQVGQVGQAERAGQAEQMEQIGRALQRGPISLVDGNENANASANASANANANANANASAKESLQTISENELEYQS